MMIWWYIDNEAGNFVYDDAGDEVYDNIYDDVYMKLMMEYMTIMMKWWPWY